LIEFTEDAAHDVASLRKFDQVRVMSAVETQLSHEPAKQTRNRNRKRLRPNRLAEWALRADNFRVFYDVSLSEQIVRVVAVGEKIGNELHIRGEKFEL
jgi:mRNA-degrading endonuclease RelE of RelBE toxin-antitoxin system